ncbi:cation diffusion facilitator family transporter [Reinekea sp.]|jgi:cation diffusion facilitator family transporter|uniref:cation diffusion facilitator family transporter n=1 Tax=Reinekea sp. TaxID=1970455 RepID=UPI002A7F68CA|nr:cation diffusion facilitator family transporter [Reinekea sp.]
MTEMNREQRFQTISRVNWVCTLVDSVLSILKLTVGFLVASPGLIADGLHSLSDLATDILALILGRLAQHGPDAEHPYGHARYETLGTVVLGVVLILVAAGIALENLFALWRGTQVTPHWIAIIAVAVSILSKEALFHYTLKYAKLTRSALLEANAWHSRSDSLSSIAVLIGIACSMAGFPLVEYLAAVAVAVLIGHMGFKLAWNAMQDLVDRGVPVAQQNTYSTTLATVTDILDVHMLRSRLMGTDVMIDAHIQVAPDLSVSEAHQINDYGMRLLKTEHPEISDVTLHIDFEPDYPDQKTKLEPKRETVLAALNRVGIEGFERMYLHYTDNRVNVELLFGDQQDLAGFAQACTELTERIIWIHSIRLYARTNPQLCAADTEETGSG